ncbi:MAG: carbohydrate kinase family protein [Clostridia bacterium]|nr:carbohydrate kinase family protein [Clostridia bacterium]
MNMVFIGHLTLDDVVLPNLPIQPDNAGGAALYAASGAHMWQRKDLFLLSRRGTDLDLSFLEGSGLDTSFVRIFPDIPTIHLFTMYDRMNLRYFIVQRWAGSYDKMAPRPYEFPQELLNSDSCFHVAAFPLPRQRAVIEQLPDNALISVDPHHDYIYPEQHGIWDALLKKITVFQPSEDELIRYFSIQPLPEPHDYLPYMKALSDKGPRIIVLKLGSRGALSYDSASDRLCFAPPCPAPVIDVTGCGDCFCGGFLASFIADGDIQTALYCGSVSASFNITHFGVSENFAVSAAEVTERYNLYLSQLKGEKT